MPTYAPGVRPTDTGQDSARQYSSPARPFIRGRPRPRPLKHPCRHPRRGHPRERYCRAGRHRPEFARSRTEADGRLSPRLDAELNQLVAQAVTGPQIRAPDRSRAPQARSSASVERRQPEGCRVWLSCPAGGIVVTMGQTPHRTARAGCRRAAGNRNPAPGALAPRRVLPAATDADWSRSREPDARDRRHRPRPNAVRSCSMVARPGQACRPPHQTR
jgi:hypothetical protein